MSDTTTASAAPGTMASVRALPFWPVIVMFWLAPLWWLLGFIDVIPIVVAVAMVGLLYGRGQTLAPPWFGWLLLFLGLMLASAFGLQLRGGSAVVWAYRAALYLSASVLFVYLYNLRAHVSERRIVRALMAYWGTTVAGGFAGVLLPHTQIRTPAYYLLKFTFPGALENDLVGQMATRRLAQDFAGSYYELPPRPAAPFIYTNNWGNVYSLLMPIAVAYVLTSPRRDRRWWMLVIATGLSTIPAFLTLNRGMFLGLGIALVVVTIRLALQGNLKSLLFLVGSGVLSGVLFILLPVQERLGTRLQGGSTEDRATLYTQALDLIRSSPLVGFGVPVPSPNPTQPAIGTQGQFWMILVSHGPLALTAFILFLLTLVVRSRHRRDLLGVTLNTVVLLSVIELLFYGILPYGLPVIFSVAALISAAPTSRPRRSSTAPPSTDPRPPGVTPATVG